MGFDKPDLGFVVHLGAPSSPVAYYQQVGRAGRATERADVLLLPGPEDRDIWRYFASASMPRQEQADAVLAALAESGRPLSTAALETVVDVRRTRLELLLKVLDVDGAVQRVTGGWTSTGRPWSYDTERYDRVAAAREREQQLDARLRAHRRLPDGVPAGVPRRRHGRALRAVRPVRRPRGSTLDPEAAGQASAPPASELAGSVSSSSRAPSGPRAWTGSGVPRQGQDRADERCEPGRAVARLTDLGWGQRLRERAARRTRPRAAEPVCGRAWRCSPAGAGHERPVAVVAMPSRRRPSSSPRSPPGSAELGRLPLPRHARPRRGRPDR